MCSRFEVEDVVDDATHVSISVDPVSPSERAQHSFTSLAYNTSEAVPNTVYYRDEENEGKARPSLDTLRLGQAITTALQEPVVSNNYSLFICS